MPKDYIPSNDADFSAWLDNFLTQTEKSKTRFRLNDADLAELGKLATDFQTSITDAQQAQVALDTKIQVKRQARAAIEAATRARVRQIQAAPDITDADRAGLRITLRDATPTRAGAPTSRPIATVDTSERLRHRLDYRDSATPTRRAKPAGVKGCEIYLYIGPEAPADPNAFRLLTLDAASPYTVEHNAADIGKTAHYLLRWLSTQDEPGPWSDTIHATITG